MERLQAEKKVLFSLPEATELIGILKEVMPGALILHFLGLDTEVSCDPDLQERAKKLIGQKVGILRLNGRFYIRSIGENISVNETPNVDDKYPKKMEHFR